jgi:DNA-binding CsgD family transcriptional regulator/catechol 2,3-dioxygenase-like lactoylglutathione lyase family enzyme
VRIVKPRGRPAHPDVLTPAEWRVVEAVRHGLGNAAIARRLGVSADAVKYHVNNALDKLALTRRADLRTWDGIARTSALHPREVPMETKPEQGLIGSIGQIARSVRDIEVARRWYGEVLGLPHLYSFGNLAFYDCAGVRLMLSQGDGGAADSILYFRVPDIHAAQAALAARGAAFISAPHCIHRHADGTEEWMAFFHDPDERPLALMSQVAPAH